MDLFTEIYNKIDIPFLNDFHKKSGYDRPEIYHYTSPEALKSIITNRTIRFTSFEYLNDKTELQYAIDLIKSVLQTNRKKYSNTYFFEEMINHYSNDNIGDSMETFMYVDINKTDGKYPIYTLKSPKRSYIFSASISDDELALWNYYSKNTSGYCLALQKAIFINDIFKTLNKDISFYAKNKLSKTYNPCLMQNSLLFGKVIYNFQYQINSLKSLLDQYYQLSKTYDLEKFKQIVQILFDTINLISPFYKYQAFKSEQEFRVVISIPEDLSYANLPDIKTVYSIVNSSFVPQIEIKLDDFQNFLEAIMIGPKTSMDFAKQGLRSFLKYSKLEQCRINTSQIPVRY